MTNTAISSAVSGANGITTRQQTSDNVIYNCTATILYDMSWSASSNQLLSTQSQHQTLPEISDSDLQRFRISWNKGCHNFCQKIIFHNTAAIFVIKLFVNVVDGLCTVGFTGRKLEPPYAINVTCGILIVFSRHQTSNASRSRYLISTCKYK